MTEILEETEIDNKALTHYQNIAKNMVVIGRNYADIQIRENTDEDYDKVDYFHLGAAVEKRIDYLRQEKGMKNAAVSFSSADVVATLNGERNGAFKDFPEADVLDRGREAYRQEAV